MNLAQGMLALIIGCRKPENRKYIGTVVTLGVYVAEGELLPSQVVRRLLRSIYGDGWIVMSNQFPGDNNYAQGHAFWSPEHLMPLPPLPENEKIKEKELEYV